MKKMYFIDGDIIYATKKYFKKYVDRKKIYIVNKSNMDRSLQYIFGYYPKEYIFDVNVFSSKEKALNKIKENAKDRISVHLIHFIKIKENIENSIKDIKILEI